MTTRWVVEKRQLCPMTPEPVEVEIALQCGEGNSGVILRQKYKSMLISVVGSLWTQGQRGLVIIMILWMRADGVRAQTSCSENGNCCFKLHHAHQFCALTPSARIHNIISSTVSSTENYCSHSGDIAKTSPSIWYQTCLNIYKHRLSRLLASWYHCMGQIRILASARHTVEKGCMAYPK